MIKILNREIPLEKFPDGTPLIRCFDDDFIKDINIFYNRDSEKSIYIHWNYETNEEMIYLMFIVKHLKRILPALVSFVLVMPYIPNARMDRVKSKNDVFTLKYFCEFINDLDFRKVYVLDAHSNVSLALLNNVEELPVAQYISKVLNEVKPDIIFCPDEGSAKRYSEIVKKLNTTNIDFAFGLKDRNFKTGEINGLDIPREDIVKGKKILIIDDICSKGGTFYHSAKKLKELGSKEIFLYVSHCENSVLDGEMIKSGLIEKIYTTESIFTKEHSIIETMATSVCL